MKLLIPIMDLGSKKCTEPIPLECLQCGKTHYRTKNIILRILKGKTVGKNKGCYCSDECKYKAKNVSIKLNCKTCNVEILRPPSEIKKVKNVFCSKSCSAKYTNSHRVRIKKPIRINNINPSTKIITSKLVNNCTCINCQSTFIPCRNSGGKYCSIKCQSEYKQNIIFSQIKDGIYPSKDPRSYKKYLISIRGHKCEMCGLTEWGNKPILLILDHINGNSDDCLISNLRLICSNCDTLTPTYKNRNKGHGRFNRRQRYKNGTSY